MKAHRFLMIMTLLLTALLGLVVTSCEYDVAEPQWDKDYTLASSPVISGVEPAGEAAPGVNTITIHGEGFVGISNTNGVYFEVPETTTVLAEIVEMTPTFIIVRRPNLATQSANIKINSDSAGLVVKYGPYRIDPVLQQYGSFLENLQLGSIAVDNAENLYVTEYVSRLIRKVTVDGQKSVVDTVTRPPTDSRVGPDGHLYVLESNRLVERLNLQSGEVEPWHRLSANRQLRFGDFDANGNLYAGGVRTDLWVIHQDSTSATADVYASDEILSVRESSGYIYVAARTANETYPSRIYRHTYDASGTLGAQELVLDLGTTAQFDTLAITSLAFSSDGKIIISTDAPNPLLVFNPANGSLDYFYKSILPPYSKQLAWGNQNYLYTIIGNTTPAQNWTVYRVDMGINGE
jgi:hypothetical protein